ncbi:hypothetical protein GGI13_008238, partial [Coemansia sp. RSA 455]
MSQGTAAAGLLATSGHSTQNYHYVQHQHQQHQHQQQSNMAQSKGLEAANYQNQALYARLGNPQANAPVAAAAMYGNPGAGASSGQGAGNIAVGHNMASNGVPVAAAGENETLYQLM